MRIARVCMPDVTTSLPSPVAGLLAALVVLAAPAASGAATRAAADHPQIAVGGFPTGIALNPLTHTIYVGNGTTGTLSLIDGATCNAGDVAGCGQHVTAVYAGNDPIGIAVDQSTNTVYVVNFSGTVAVVNGRNCDATNTSGCKIEPATVRVGANPQFLAVDEKSDTIYVANGGSNTVSVIDGRTCNAASRAGCRRVRASIPVGPGPFAVAVNDATRSVYITDVGAKTISVLDGRTCNARDVRGCRHRPTVNVGGTPAGIAVDMRTDTIYVTGESSNDVSVIDGKTCNAMTASGCRQKPVHVLAGLGARGIAVNEVTDTVYVANTAANTVSVINGATCNATVHTGCGQQAAAAAVGVSPRRVAVDELTNTIYVTNAVSNTVTMLNGRTCNGLVSKGCGAAGAPSGTTPSTTTPTTPTTTGPYTARPRQR
jgi:YVTN family beta-propeller protein